MTEVSSSSTDLTDRLTALQQAGVLTLQARQDWVDSATANDPQEIQAHLERLRGFDASDIAALVCAADGHFHPNADPAEVTRRKLLLEPVGIPNSDARRVRALGHIAQQWHRQKVLQGGGQVREDLADQVRAYVERGDAEHPWLIGWDGDIVQENGRLCAVTYSCPDAVQFQQWQTEGLSIAEQIASHHAWVLAVRAGVPVESLRHVAFGADQWESVDTDVPIQAAWLNRIIEVGARTWAVNVLTGNPAPSRDAASSRVFDSLALNTGLATDIPVPDTAQRADDGSPVYIDRYRLGTDTLPRLRDQVLQIGTEIFGHAVLKGETEKMRDALLSSLRAALPMRILLPGVGKFNVGPIQLKAQWCYHPDRLLDAAKGALAMLGQSDEEIQTMLNSENFFAPATYALEPLLHALRTKKGIDPDGDPDFAVARLTERERRVDSLVALLQDVGRHIDGGVDWTELIDYSTSQLNAEVIRAPVSGFGRNLRDQTARSLRQVAVPAVRHFGAEHVRRLQEEQNQEPQPGSRPSARRAPRP